MKSNTFKHRFWLGLLLGTSLMASAVPITFQVNMSAQKSLGNFDPAADSVFAAGSFNSWSTSDLVLAPSAADPGIYVATFDDITDAVGSTIQYKYVLSTAAGLTWEGNVGGAGGTGNRSFALADTAQVLPVVYFNNITNGALVNAEVTFQVNMSLQLAQGTFDPAVGTVSVAGDFNNWTTGLWELTNSVTDTNLWTGTFKVSGPLDGAFSYKYVIYSSNWENNGVGPGGAQNRSGTLTSANVTLPAVYFNNLTSLPSSIPLTFTVNLAAQIALGAFDPDTATVEARGSFNSWAAGFVLTNNPAVSPRLYSGTWVDTNDSPGLAVAYQFVLGGTVWEPAVGNRSYTITSTNEQVLPTLYFNNVGNLGAIAVSPVANGQTTASWTAAPAVRLQTATSLNPPSWQDVPNTLGQGSAKVNVAAGQVYLRLVGP